MNKLIFEKITFFNFKYNELYKIFKKNRLFSFPSALKLINIFKNITCKKIK